MHLITRTALKAQRVTNLIILYMKPNPIQSNALTPASFGFDALMKKLDIDTDELDTSNSETVEQFIYVQGLIDILDDKIAENNPDDILESLCTPDEDGYQPWPPDFSDADELYSHYSNKQDSLSKLKDNLEEFLNDYCD